MRAIFKLKAYNWLIEIDPSYATHQTKKNFCIKDAYSVKKVHSGFKFPVDYSPNSTILVDGVTINLPFPIGEIIRYERFE